MGHRIDENDMVKVSDFGLTEDIYSYDYYCEKGNETGKKEKVPIKWMAPESIETYMFDESTDVVSERQLTHHENNNHVYHYNMNSIHNRNYDTYQSYDKGYLHANPSNLGESIII